MAELITIWVNEGEKPDKYKMAYTGREIGKCPYCIHWDAKFDYSKTLCSQCSNQHTDFPLFEDRFESKRG